MRYSNDLRKKAIKLLEKRKKQTEVAELLEIDKATIYRWNKRYKATGIITAKDYNRTGNRRKINNLPKFKKFLKKNYQLSLKEMAHKWQGVSYMCISNTIKKLGYSYKKNSGYILNETPIKDLNI